jgi:hypothetical protein
MGAVLLPIVIHTVYNIKPVKNSVNFNFFIQTNFGFLHISSIGVGAASKILGSVTLVITFDYLQCGEVQEDERDVVGQKGAGMKRLLKWLGCSLM